MMDNVINFLLELLLQPWIFEPLVYPGLVTVFIMLLFLIWLERKIAGKVQLRYGPLYVLRRLGGAIQLVADLLKFLLSEVIVPEESDKLAFVLSPCLLFAFSLLPTVIIPVGPEFHAVNSEISLLVIAALLTIPPVFTLALSWASNNKFSFIGGLREGYLMISYEIPIFMSLLAMAALYGSLDLVEIAEAQKSIWGIIVNPIAALVFLVAMFISTSKFPFEIAEAESEIVMGPFTEYSGIIYGLCMGASYVKMYVLSLLFTILFLGGWNPIIWPFTESPILPGLIVLGKALIIMFIGVFLRAVYPRYRVDQAIRIGWHTLFTLSVISVMLSVFVAVGGYG